MPDKTPYHPHPDFIDLVQRVLDKEASLEDIAHLNNILPADPNALAYFVKMRMLHATLIDTKGSTTHKIVSLQEAAKKSAPVHVSEEKSTKPTPLRKYALAAAALILLSLTATFLYNKLAPQNAYQIVASTSDQNPNSLNRGQWLKTKNTYQLKTGTIELHSPDGNKLTIQAPAKFSIDSSHNITLTQGKLWAVLDGKPLNIQTPQGLIQDLGTTFGIDQSNPKLTRIDVLDGEIKLSASDKLSKTAAKGSALISQKNEWPPDQVPADATRYHTGLRTPIGFAFVKDNSEAAAITAENPMDTKWTPLTTPTGTTTPDSATFKISWAGAPLYSENSNQSPESKIYHTHIQGWKWTDQINAQAKTLGFPTDQDIGIAIQLKGMQNWLTQIGANGYNIEILRNSGVENVNLLPITAQTNFNTPPLEILHTLPADLHHPNYPDTHNGQIGNRATTHFNTLFTDNTLTLTIPTQNENIHEDRSNISAIRVIPTFVK